MAVTSTGMTAVAKFGRLLSISYGQARIRLHLASRKHGTLYVGVTSNLSARIHQHKQGTASAFTRRYKVHRLVYFEEFELITDAIRRENTIKGWPRAWKIRTIEAINPDWKDLTEEMWMA